LDITTDDQTGVQAWGETLNMADRFQLTVYDAAYPQALQGFCGARRSRYWG
jgi:hypothetical protein